MLTAQELQAKLAAGPLILDGATGSNLMKAGMPRGCCTEEWVLNNPEALRTLQRAYREAGSDILYAPTFQAQPIALERVNLADFCRSQDGLQTALHEGGSNLSGGQRQRLAMARALLHDTPIYLFDEATSNVDAESENDIMAAIRSLAGRKTVILISHRLANVVDSDCIYVLDKGRIAERGTHAELLKKQGAYSRLYTAQKQLETLETEDA